ncbi:sigma-54 interaction domain-containing protein [Halotalea alkalilenta]|uniref:sigma-54 interaction domain-containing protein n=1 Tax=Halotalea alkalilenta TaxID=376489 RepID=UPI00048914E1|nr:sigma 54-interacting transcriptional regulator [Halotalea alkalilenta]
MPTTTASIDSATLEVLFEASHDHLVLTDASGRILRASPSACAVYGLSMQALSESNVHTLEAQGVFAPSVTRKVLASQRAEQVLQTTPTGRRVLAEAYPVRVDGRLVRVISRSRDLTDLEQEYAELQRQLDAQLREPEQPPTLEGIEASSPAMRRLVTLLARVAATRASIVLLGESGVGKTALARQVHRQSERAGGPFVEVNCAAIPETLFESEMFGYLPGAFSGAARQGKPGLLEQADGGTLFLDEIGELGLGMQSKLLKVLQDGMVMRLGDTRARQLDFRLIVATHRDLAREVEEGRFRLDLYYRLNVVPAWIPPLRERREEIPALVERQRARLKQRYGLELSLDARQWGYLMSHAWPGNVRELENHLERLCLAGDTALAPSSPPTADPAPPPALDELETESLDLATALDATERRLLERALTQGGGTRAIARRLGISQPSVVRKLAKHGLNRRRPDADE